MVLDQKVEECRIPRNANNDNVTTNNGSSSTSHRLIPPFKGEQEQEIVKSVSNYIKTVLPENCAAQHVYKSRKLSSLFNVKY